MIAIIDYGMGNLDSVAKAAVFLGKKAVVSDKVSVVKKADKIIFPGVGHFAKAIKELKSRRIFNPLIDKIVQGTPFLGICLGMQLLLEESEEAPGIKGLGVIKGRVKLLKTKGLIVPHMGWNQLEIKNQKLKIKNAKSKTMNLFKDIPDNSYFYFAHSYYCLPEDKNTIAAVTDYGINFVSVLNKSNIWGVQFHPEKSQELGLRVFRNFLDS